MLRGELIDLRPPAAGDLDPLARSEADPDHDSELNTFDLRPTAVPSSATATGTISSSTANCARQ